MRSRRSAGNPSLGEQAQLLARFRRYRAEAAGEVLPYAPLCAVFRRYLHARKLKFTPERALILDAVLRRDGLFSAEQVVTELGKPGHDVSRATVYRTLSHLQDAGILKQVFFDNRQSFYEVVAGRQARDYLICVATGRVVEFSSEKLRQLRDEICREHGFEPLSHRFQVFGVSPEGRSQGRRTAQHAHPPQRGSAHRGKGRQRKDADPDLHPPEDFAGEKSH